MVDAIKKLKEFTIRREVVSRGNVAPDHNGCCCPIGQYVAACGQLIQHNAHGYGLFKEILMSDGSLEWNDIDSYDVWGPNDTPGMPDEAGVIAGFAKYGVTAKFEGEYLPEFIR
jgi:hypothetical protein